MNGLFVTGTDTNVGKTVISAGLMRALRGTKNICYWKPVQTGIEADDDTQTIRELANCSAGEIFNEGFRLEKPLSPHLSARLAGVSITVAKTLDFISNHTAEKFWIVEGAGGVLVPLGETEMMIDLMKALNLPVVVAARAGLGTINHTLLTLEVLRRGGLKIFGVIMNGEPNEENRRAIERFGKTKVLAQMPEFKTLTSENLKTWADENLNDFRVADRRNFLL